MLYRPPGSAGLMHFRTHRAHGCATKGPDLECKDVPQYVVVSCMFIYFHVISYLYTCHVEIVNQVRSYWLTFQSYKYSTRGVLNKRRGLEQLRISDLDVVSDNVWNILESFGRLTVSTAIQCGKEKGTASQTPMSLSPFDRFDLPCLSLNMLIFLHLIVSWSGSSHLQ